MKSLWKVYQQLITLVSERKGLIIHLDAIDLHVIEEFQNKSFKGFFGYYGNDIYAPTDGIEVGVDMHIQAVIFHVITPQEFILGVGAASGGHGRIKGG